MNFYENSTKQKVLFCNICGVQMSYKGIGRIPKVCSAKCKNKHDTNIRISNGNYHKQKQQVVCEYCFCNFETALDSQKFCSNECRSFFGKANNNLKLNLSSYSCMDCSSYFVRHRAYTSFQIEKGVRCDTCRKNNERHKNAKKNKLRNSVLSNPRISLEVVAQRDNLTCYICNELVDMKISRMEKLGATLDHIKPLSKGGLDTMENVALAHWICNVKKGDRYDS